MTDTTRIERVASTIEEISNKGGKVVLLAHFGRPKGGPDEANSLRPVAAAVADIVKRPVAFATDCIGKTAADAIAKMKNGDILLLENTRFYKGEEKNDPVFVEELAKLGDIYVNDAFSAAHRAHASTEGVAHKLPAYAGRAMQAEPRPMLTGTPRSSRRRPASCSADPPAALVPDQAIRGGSRARVRRCRSRCRARSRSRRAPGRRLPPLYPS